MSQENEKPIGLGVYGRQQIDSLSAAEIIALALTVFWLIITGYLFLFSGGSDAAAATDRLTTVMMIVAVVLPIAMIWMAAIAARNAKTIQQETARLESAVDSMRQAYLTQSQTAGMGVKPSVEQKLDEIVASAKQTESAIVTFATSRAGTSDQSKPAIATPEPDEAGQTAFALGTPAEEIAPPISIPDFIRALNFPENVDDTEGFDALRRALSDRQTAKLVQASQDVLTLLSQDGIYMDDLRPDRTRPELWRKFAQGERGGAISGLGGVRDRSGLALAAGRMRQDQIFRDAVHHFLREFDKTVAVFAENATDEDIAALSGTRTARAFMLLGRVAGTFD